MPSDFEQQLDDAFETLTDTHGERGTIEYFLFEQKDKAVELEDVIIHIGGDSDEANQVTHKREAEATLIFDLKQLVRSPLIKDFCRLPGHKGDWSFRAITEQVGTRITCRFTQPLQTRHRGGK